MPDTSRRSFFSPTVIGCPLLYFLAAANTPCLNDSLPIKADKLPPRAVNGFAPPPANPPATPPTKATAIDSNIIGPCCAKFATNQSTRPLDTNSPDSFWNSLWNGWFLYKSASASSTHSLPVSSLP